MGDTRNGTWISGFCSGVASFETRDYGTILISLEAFEHNPGLYSISRDPNNENGYHEYYDEYNTGISTSDIPYSAMVYALHKNPTPFTAEFAGPGWVFQAQPNGVNYIVNVTEPNYQHLLNPGVVKRQVVIVDGEYIIETVGIGVGNLGQLNT